MKHVGTSGPKDPIAWGFLKKSSSLDLTAGACLRSSPTIRSSEHSIQMVARESQDTRFDSNEHASSLSNSSLLNSSSSSTLFRLGPHLPRSVEVYDDEERRRMRRRRSMRVYQPAVLQCKHNSSSRAVGWGEETVRREINLAFLSRCFSTVI